VHYQKLLGNGGAAVPAEGSTITDHVASPEASVQDEDGVKLFKRDQAELQSMSQATDKQDTAGGWDFGASIANVLPTINGQPMGVGVSWGGSNVGAGLSAVATWHRNDAAKISYKGSRSARMAAHVVREHEWVLQSNLAAKDLMQIDKQIAGAQIRFEIAKKELDNHKKQIEHAEVVEEHLRTKYTNQQLYQWMIGQIAGLYFQSYQLAYDLAKRSERAFRRELGLRDSGFIKFGYWDSMRKGLMAGERLSLDLKRWHNSTLERLSGCVRPANVR
jgi:hypothetical protein